MKFIQSAFTISALAGATFFACGPASKPPEGKGTAYPCGVWGVECRDGACCPWAHICGGPDGAGFTRCEPGYCCADGDPLYGAVADGGSSRKVRARKRP